MSGLELERVLVVDDDPMARQGYSLAVEDADLESVLMENPLGPLDSFVANTPTARAGALCDFDLSKKNFASFTGAQLVAAWYRAGTPAVLCTRFEKAQLDRIRPYRQFIPRLMTPSDLDSDSLRAGLEVVQKEIAGVFLQSRTAHRTLVRVLERDEDNHDYFLFEMPGWSQSLDAVLRYKVSDLPKELQPKIKEGFRTHVRANLGAEAFEDLYFTDWALA